jgi:hypothetical protein
MKRIFSSDPEDKNVPEFKSCTYMYSDLPYKLKHNDSNNNTNVEFIYDSNYYRMNTIKEKWAIKKTIPMSIMQINQLYFESFQIANHSPRDVAIVTKGKCYGSSSNEVKKSIVLPKCYFCSVPKSEQQTPVGLMTMLTSCKHFYCLDCILYLKYLSFDCNVKCYYSTYTNKYGFNVETCNLKSYTYGSASSQSSDEYSYTYCNKPIALCTCEIKKYLITSNCDCIINMETPVDQFCIACEVKPSNKSQKQCKCVVDHITLSERCKVCKQINCDDLQCKLEKCPSCKKMDCSDIGCKKQCCKICNQLNCITIHPEEEVKNKKK